MLMFTIINLRSKWIKIAFGVVIIGLLISLPYFFGLHKRLSLVTQPDEKPTAHLLRGDAGEEDRHLL